MRKALWFLVIAIYATVVFALTVVRTPEAEETPILFRIARSIVLVVCTVGPALLIESRLWRLRATAEAERDLARLRQERRTLRREYRRADQDLHNVGKHQARWDPQAARFRALYLARYYRIRPSQPDHPIKE